MPKGVILLASVISIFGVVSYFSRGSERANLVSSKSIGRLPQNVVVDKAAANTATVQSQPQIDNRSFVAANSIEDRRPQALASMQPAAKVQVEAVEPVYICGAATKKGTPCSRRVKGNVRCWQHAGQPAILPPEQLRVSR